MNEIKQLSTQERYLLLARFFSGVMDRKASDIEMLIHLDQLHEAQAAKTEHELRFCGDEDSNEIAAQIDANRHIIEYVLNLF